MAATLEPPPDTQNVLHDHREFEPSLDDHVALLELMEDSFNHAFQGDPSSNALAELISKFSQASPLPLLLSPAPLEISIDEEKEVDANVSMSIKPPLSDSALSKLDITIKEWDGTTFFSDFIKAGIEYNNNNPDKTIMLFESPSSSAVNTSFHNCEQFKFHDYPAPNDYKVKAVLGPCRYSLMNGSALPVFLRGGVHPPGLLEHWSKTVPGCVLPTFVSEISDDNTVYAYLPVERIKNHVNDPNIHYHLVGKDTIGLMTEKTTKCFADTREYRPCVVKTTHSMGGRGIFVIRNDDDEAKVEQFLAEAGNPSYLVTEFVEIERNVACHFFMHPNGKDVTWFGSNENKRLPDGSFCSDSYLDSADQENLKRMQLPFVMDVVEYCKSLGFWGFCGIDVLFDSTGRGYLVDVNPRVTGSCPGLMTLALMRENFGYQVALLRRSGNINFYGTPKELFEQVDAYNAEHMGSSRVVIHSMYEPEEGGRALCRINIAVYGNDMDECRTVLNQFAKPPNVPL